MKHKMTKNAETDSYEYRGHRIYSVEGSCFPWRIGSKRVFERLKDARAYIDKQEAARENQGVFDS